MHSPRQNADSTVLTQPAEDINVEEECDSFSVRITICRSSTIYTFSGLRKADTIRDLKIKFSERIGGKDVDKIILTYRGQDLDDNDKLSQTELTEDALIYAFVDIDQKQ